MRKVLCLVLPILSISASVFRIELENVYWVLLISVYICSNHFLVNELIRFYLNFTLTDPRKSLLIIQTLYSYIFIGFAVFQISGLLYFSKIDELLLFIAIIIVLLLHKVLYQFSPPELKSISENNNLSFGYGAALCYYENYLKLTLQEYPSRNDFLTRIRIFESRQEVEVFHRHVILIPRSCKVPTYIDNNVSILRCKEMEPLLMNVSGIPNRKYNITVYNIRHRNRSVRLSIEYAQPLKALMAMKEKNLLTLKDLALQREIFTKFLRQMLRDSHNSHELVELIEYDDEELGFKLEDLLMDNKSIFDASVPIKADNETAASKATILICHE